ncbi:MAG: menaquinone biosynthetic enzyme MqnA/MqnD family protein, partial [Candidatus Methylomirabilales bacterium]
MRSRAEDGIRPRVGRVRYINCEPVYYAIERGIVPANVQIVDDTPTRLNELLREGALDVSVISALEYVKHPEFYLLLPELAIACDGAVESVLFLSRVSPGALHRRKTLLTRKSLTARSLIRLIFERLYRIAPLFVEGDLSDGLALPEDAFGVLLIGDEALRAKAKRLLPYILDLGSSWKELTGMPFVFAVWAVRRDFYLARQEEAHALHRALLASKAWSQSHVEAIAREVHRRIGLDFETCLAYLRDRLSFD